MVKKILLVDDLVRDAQLTQRAISDCAVEHEIVVAHDGEDALLRLREDAFDLILLDLKMPTFDGFDILKQVRSTPSLSHIPAVVLSGSDREVDRIRAQMLGAADYVHKASDYDAYRHNLKHVLSLQGYC